MPPGTAPFLGYLPPSTPHSINLMLGGREGGQVRGGSGLCQGSAGDPEGLSRVGRQGTNEGWVVGEVASLRRVGLEQLPVSVLGPAHSPDPPSTALPPYPRPFPRNPFARIIHKRAHYKMT